MLGISRDSVESHKKFREKHGLSDITLLSDTKGRVMARYGAAHRLLPVARRVYIVVGKDRRILFIRDTGFSLLENQTETLLNAIDAGIR